MCTGSTLLVCLLLAVASFTSTVQAARPRQQRNQAAQQDVILPPGLVGGTDSGTLPKSLGVRDFQLRHIYHHGSHIYPRLHRYIDVPADAQLQVLSDDGESYEPAPDTLRVNAQTISIQRLARRNESDINDLLAHADWYGAPADLPASAWTEDRISAPNTTDKTTIVTFAKMAANAYRTTPGDPGWAPVKGGFNYTDDFGWEADGLRGHIFADETNATVVIGLKGTSTWLDNLDWLFRWLEMRGITEIDQLVDLDPGTSPAVFDGSDTTGNDKLNDNLFGSCCCGQGGNLFWKTVCECSTATYTCNSTCLVKSIRDKGHYYNAVRELYSNVTERYPNSDVWLSGHSLGGVVSSLLGLTYGLPTLTFEAFPDAMAASRLGLPMPPGYKIGSVQSRSKTGVYHFGHTADPIYMGTCNGPSSFCTIAGYAFEGLCHTGQTCIYDTVNDLGWRVGIGTHKIDSVIKDVLEKYDTVPGCEEDVDCQDCALWKFFKSNGTETTTSTKAPHKTTSSTITSRTRTETCKTPGWWGCLDESTTTTRTGTTTTTTSSTSTSTCKTPGWFGCKDPITTTSTSKTSKSPKASPAPTVTTTTSISTSTCETPGWFGCYDSTTTTIATPKPTSGLPTATATSTSTEADSCTSREWFGLICVDPSAIPTTSSTRPSSTNLPTTRRKQCAARHWYGSCKAWEDAEPKNDLRR